MCKKVKCFYILYQKDYYELSDYKLILTYHLRTDKEFKNFETNILFKNRMFEDFHELESNIGVYIFDFHNYKSDLIKIVNGKYSLLSDDYKKAIMKFYQKSNIGYHFLVAFSSVNTMHFVPF